MGVTVCSSRGNSQLALREASITAHMRIGLRHVSRARPVLVSRHARSAGVGRQRVVAVCRVFVDVEAPLHKVRHGRRSLGHFVVFASHLDTPVRRREAVALFRDLS